MLVMPSNNTGSEMREIAAAHPGMVGHLFGPEPGGWRTPFLPYALDNGAFGAWKNQERWQQKVWLALLDKAEAHQRQSGHGPQWVLIPDVVGDREKTLEKWAGWATQIRRWYGWPLAFAAQDGMTGADIPAEADVVFIGGTTRWKRRMLGHFCARFPRVHVGRINTRRWLWVCAEFGAESCDGTGWFRGDQDQLAGLRRFLREWSAGHRKQPDRHPSLWDTEAA
jgi:hypothetical protein